MQRYDSYKDSGIQWLGEIPSHWEVVKLKSLCQMFGRIGFRGYSKEDLVDEGDGAITLSPSNFREGKIDFSKCSWLSWQKYYESPEIMVTNGDIVFVKTASIGKTAIVKDIPCETTINPQILVLKRITCCAEYLNYYLQNTKIQGWINASANGSTISTISQGTIGNYPIFLPSLSEQQAIASYLDTATAKIDEAIAQQQKMIDLLNERKQIIINNAVTKGLNPNAKMKPSGIDWIGNIPEHWGTRAIKFLFNQRNEYNTPIKTSERLSLSIDKGVTLYSEKTTNLDRFKEDVSQYKVTYPNDIILNSMNMIVGAVGLSKYMGCVSPAYYVIYASTKIDVFYYSYLLNIRSIRAVYRVLGRGIYSIDRGDGRVNTCRLKVPYGDFSRIEVPLPPYEEQKQISLYLKSQQKRIDIKIEMCNKQIALLQERKQIIINDVVTGKVKVSKK